MAEQSPDKPRQREKGRPDPEELLRRYDPRDRDLEAPPSVPVPGTFVTGALQPTAAGYAQQRGRLHVYLGAVAGAGKSYAMLNEGNRRKGRSTDVVIGYVETHGRLQTQAQIGDLEIIPRKQVEYRSVTLEDMDTQAILARHPKVVLIDELAHTNMPGSKHTKRYQDVLEILDAAIDVVTSITGVRVRETLPDWVLDQTDEVELVDISPYALRRRMKDGNIYPRERIEAALNHFFREGNLTELRKLALRRTAEKTGSHLQQYMIEQGMDKLWASSECELVGFDHRPHTCQVIRYAWRLAHGLHAELIAVSIVRRATWPLRASSSAGSSIVVMRSFTGRPLSSAWKSMPLMFRSGDSQ